MTVTGGLLALIAAGALASGAYGLWLHTTQRTHGYVMASSERFATNSYGLATRTLHISSDVPSFLYGREWLGSVRIRGKSANPNRPLFIGIARKTDVDRYLAGVAHSDVVDISANLFGTSYRPTYHAQPGGRPAFPPDRASFWAARVAGRGNQALTWSVKPGRWAIVVMRPDGSRGVSAQLAAGAKLPALLWASIALAVLGLLTLGGAAALIYFGAQRTRSVAARGTSARHNNPRPPDTDASAPSAERGLTVQEEVRTMSTHSTTAPPLAPVSRTRPAERLDAEADRYEGIQQYSLKKILAVWAAAALPMGALAWIVAPLTKGWFSGPKPLVQSLLAWLTAGLIWQFVLVLILVRRETGSFEWARVRDALWLRPPRDPKTKRVGGKVWWWALPFLLGFAAWGAMPSLPIPSDMDLVKFLGSDSGQHFLSGAWGWFAAIVTLAVFNTVLGEELLFRGLLLPRMRGVFGNRDWVANGAIFALYHLHMPWEILPTFVDGIFFDAYPSRRFQSAWMGIIVHSGQSLVLIGLVLALVVK